MIVTHDDAKAFGYCNAGLRKWFPRDGVTFDDFRQHGVTAEWLRATLERAPEDVLAGASPDMLNALLAGVDAAALFRGVDDRWLGPDHRTELTRLLTQDRIDDLTLESRAAILYALQAGWTSGPDEQGILAVLRATRGVDLTRLKNLVNSRTDSHDLEGLVFVDVISPDIRQEILDHIAAEASGFHTGECKVLSDIAINDPAGFKALVDKAAKAASSPVRKDVAQKAA